MGHQISPGTYQTQDATKLGYHDVLIGSTVWEIIPAGTQITVIGMERVTEGKEIYWCATIDDRGYREFWVPGDFLEKLFLQQAHFLSVGILIGRKR